MGASSPHNDLRLNRTKLGLKHCFVMRSMPRKYRLNRTKLGLKRGTQMPLRDHAVICLNRTKLGLKLLRVVLDRVVGDLVLIAPSWD